MTEAYGALVERAKGHQRALEEKPWIRVGTAICGQAAGANEVAEALRREVAHIGMDATVSEVVADMQPATKRPPDLLVANLPYIPTGEIRYLQRDVRDFEPHIALDGGSDGFALHRRLIHAAAVRLGGAMVLEIGYEHGDAVRSAASLRSADLQVDVFADLVGLDRVALITGWS